MRSGLTAALATALEASRVEPLYLAKFEFPGGDVRFWSGRGDLSFDGETYTGLGDLENIQFPEESSDGSATGAVFVLSGIPSTTTSLAVTENYKNRPCTVWLAALDSGGSLIADPYIMFAGLMDVITMSDDGKTATIQLKAEGFAYGAGPSLRRYTDEDQQRAFSGDLGLEFVKGLSDKQIFWGHRGPQDRPKRQDYDDDDDDPNDFLP